MKYKWLNKKNNKKIILFFNGWGMDENIVKTLNTEDFDVLMFYDYRNLDTDFDFSEIANYTEKNIIAWSMGVMIATLINIDNITQAIAINGTLKPIHSEYGINPKIYDLTIRNFNELGRKKFVQNMFDKNFELNFTRKLEEQKEELIALLDYNANLNFKYNKIIVSDNDKIIPSKNQSKFWEIDANYTGGHCIFQNFSKWSELL